jgi:hypothetical protein
MACGYTEDPGTIRSIGCLVDYASDQRPAVSDSPWRATNPSGVVVNGYFRAQKWRMVDIGIVNHVEHWGVARIPTGLVVAAMCERVLMNDRAERVSSANANNLAPLERVHCGSNLRQRAHQKFHCVMCIA